MRYLLIVLLSVFLINNSLSQDADDIKRLLPDEEYLSGFVSNGNFEEYMGDDLFFLINGGAEIYHEFGFVKVLKSDYSLEDKNLSIEIYEMDDPLAAYGLYSMFRMKDNKIDRIGDMAQVIKNHAMLLKDKYFIKFTSNIDLSESEGVLSKVCEGVSQKIGESKFVSPELISYLPEVISNIRYIRGYLAVNNIYPFILRDIFNFNQGISGFDKRENLLWIILEYKNDSTAKSDFDAIIKEVRNMKKYTQFELSGNFFEMLDKKDNSIRCSLKNSLIVLHIKIST